MTTKPTVSAVAPLGTRGLPDLSKTAIPRRQFLAGATAGVALTATGTGLSGAQPQGSRNMADFRERLLQCLGGPWPEQGDLRPQLRETIQKDGYRIESVFYEAGPDDKIPAMLLIPEGVDAANPAPAVAVWHQHNGQWHLGPNRNRRASSATRCTTPASRWHARAT